MSAAWRVSAAAWGLDAAAPRDAIADWACCDKALTALLPPSLRKLIHVHYRSSSHLTGENMFSGRKDVAQADDRS